MNYWVLKGGEGLSSDKTKSLGERVSHSGKLLPEESIREFTLPVLICRMGGWAWGQPVSMHILPGFAGPWPKEILCRR